MADANELRSQMILRDIYARHKLDPSMPLDAQIEAINNGMLERDTPLAPGMWANPEERGQARGAYAAKGKTDREKQDRWEQSAYLIDPNTYQYQQNAGRDIDFLKAMYQANNTPQVDTATNQAARAAGGTFDNVPTRDTYRDEALHYWDKSNFQPTSRNGMMDPNYQSQSGLLMGLLNATTNPDTTTGNYLNFSEVIPDRVRMGGSGEADTGEEAWQAAQAKRLANNRYRPNSMTPIGDLPSSASGMDRAIRLSELQELVGKADVPSTDQRWARWTKQNLGKSFVPPGFVNDTLDFATSWLDPTAVVPVGGLAAGAVGTVAKGAKVAGGGWMRPLLTNLVKSRGVDAAKDMGFEQGIGHSLNNMAGGGVPRSSQQYLFGNWSGDVPQKSEEDVQASRNARTQLYDKLRNDDGVSRADNEAYNGLGLRVHVPYPYR
jgi:hypothetical protein